MIDYVKHWSDRAETPAKQIVQWIGIAQSKYFDWKKRYGKVNEHNGAIPRDFWMEDWEKRAILDFHHANPLEGYRRLTFMMLDKDIVALSPSSVYRVLSAAGVMDRFNGKKSKKGTGFVQPTRPHDHWHVDISYLNIGGTFYFMCSVLDGCSRSIIHWEIREKMEECDVEVILQRAREKYPHAKPRLITDNGPQFIARDFKEFVRIAGMTHVKTSPYYPQSNGKIERYHRTIKSDCIRQKYIETVDDARSVVANYVHHYNEVRLHSAIGYVTPQTKLLGIEREVFALRDRKLAEAREQRRLRRHESQAA